MFIISRSPQFIVKGFYAEMYPISLAAFNYCVYAFGLNNLMHTFHVEK